MKTASAAVPRWSFCLPGLLGNGTPLQRERSALARDDATKQNPASPRSPD